MACTARCLSAEQEHAETADKRAWLELVVRPSVKGHSTAVAGGGYRRTYLTPSTCASRLWCGSVCSGVTCAPRQPPARHAALGCRAQRWRAGA